MFFGGQNPEWFDRPANKYNIFQSKLPENPEPKIKEVKNINVSRSIGSVGAVVSDSHYSFESESINDLTSVKKPEEEPHEFVEQKKRVIHLPKQLLEEGSPQHQNILNRSKEKEELSYSESEDENIW